MDLFGKKAQRALAIAQIELEWAAAWITDLQDRLEAEIAKGHIREGAIDRLRQDNLTLIRKCDELERKPRRMSAAPLYKSEEEEELEYALRNGDIDMREFKDLMAQAGFDNTEIELPERPERPIVY